MPLPEKKKKVSDLNRRGDLLMTYGHAWEYGQTHVDCEDFDTGERVSMEIPRGAYRPGPVGPRGESARTCRAPREQKGALLCCGSCRLVGEDFPVDDPRASQAVIRIYTALTPSAVVVFHVDGNVSYVHRGT